VLKFEKWHKLRNKLDPNGFNFFFLLYKAMDM